jgi:hypothetical protein
MYPPYVCASLVPEYAEKRAQKHFEIDYASLLTIVPAEIPHLLLTPVRSYASRLNPAADTCLFSSQALLVPEVALAIERFRNRAKAVEEAMRLHSVNNMMRKVTADIEHRDVLIPAGTTKFALGMSAGGNFSHLLGTIGATPVAAELPQLRFAAVVSYCADATASRSSSLSTTPSAWYMCAADDNSEVSNAEARANEAALRRRGVATDYAENAPTPLYDQRFTRIDGIDVATSTAMAAELRAAGFTDAAGLITRSSDEIAAIVSADPASFPTITSIPRPNLVRLQLKVMRAEHAMFADMTRRTIDFFDRFNPMPPT